MIHITIEAATIAELRARLNEVLGDEAPKPKPEAPDAPKPKLEAPDAPKPETKDAPKPAAAEEPVEADDAPPTMEEARSALNDLRARKGPKAVKEILTAHNVKSFVDLPAGEYAAVIKEAKASAV